MWILILLIDRRIVTFKVTSLSLYPAFVQSNTVYVTLLFDFSKTINLLF